MKTEQQLPQTRFIPKRACEGATTYCVFSDQQRQCPHSQCAVVVDFDCVPTVEQTTEVFTRHCRLTQTEDLAASVVRLRSERDELLAALKAMVEDYEEADMHPTNDGHPLYAARAAIARVDGK